MKALYRAAVREPPGDIEAPRDEQQAEAIIISRPEDGGEGIVLEDSSKRWSHREESPHRSCRGGMEALSEPQNKAERKAAGEMPSPLSSPAL